MVQVRFITAKDEKIVASAAAGDRLLEVGQRMGLPLEGTCEGQMACSTCHVIVAERWFARLPDASEEEEDMLDLAANVSPTSRLGCQIVLTNELDGLEVRMPDDFRDIQRW